jgi:hypothetical protein
MEVTMRFELSPELKLTIDDYIDDLKNARKILDVYKAAAQIRERHISENVALEDIIERLVMRAGTDCLVEFRTPSTILLTGANTTELNGSSYSRSAV